MKKQTDPNKLINRKVLIHIFKFAIIHENNPHSRIKSFEVLHKSTGDDNVTKSI